MGYEIGWWRTEREKDRKIAELREKIAKHQRTARRCNLVIRFMLSVIAALLAMWFIVVIT